MLLHARTHFMVYVNPPLSEDDHSKGCQCPPGFKGHGVNSCEGFAPLSFPPPNLVPTNSFAPFPLPPYFGEDAASEELERLSRYLSSLIQRMKLKSEEEEKEKEKGKEVKGEGDPQEQRNVKVRAADMSPAMQKEGVPVRSCGDEGDD